MPKAIAIDHEQVRSVALQVGVREAARQFGLKASVVMKWSAEEKWFAHLQAAKDAQLALQAKQGITVKTSGDVMLGYGEKTKLNSAKTLYKTSKGFAKKTPDELLKLTQQVKNNVDSAAKVFGWEEKQDHRTLVNINLLSSDYRETKDVSDCEQSWG